MATNHEHIMAAGRFKAQCLREIDQVQQTGETLVITKRGKPIVKIIPIAENEEGTYFGCMKDTLSIEGDITLPIIENWDIEEGNI